MNKAVFILVIFIVFCDCSELEISDNGYEFIDGISVQKREKVQEVREKEQRLDDRDTENDDDDELIYKDEITEDDAPEEDEELTKNLPTKCHACRLLVVELEEKLSKLGKVRKQRKNRAPVYYKDNKVILYAIQNLCKRMKNYNIRRSHSFRYKRGVKSYFRRQFEDEMKNSRVKDFMFFTPEDEIDDPTGEIQRLQNQCHDLLVDNQHDLIHWFHKAQSRDLVTWFCRNRVLVDKNQDCLDQEFLTRRNKIKDDDEREKVQKEEKNESKTKHEEL